MEPLSRAWEFRRFIAREPGAASGIKHTCDLAQPLADPPCQRHIDDPTLLS